MNKYDRIDSINVIKPLHYVANILALVPPFKLTKLKLQVKHRFLAIAYTILISTCFVVSLYFIIATTVIKSPALFIVLILSYGAATFQYIISVMISAFWQSGNIHQFISNFYEVDKQFPKFMKQSNEKKLNTFVLEIVITHLAYLLFFTGDFYFHLKQFGVMYFVYNRLLKRVEMYLILIVTLIMYNYCLCIKLRFKKLNVILESLVHNHLKKIDTENVHYTIINTSSTICDDIRKVRIAYNLLTNMVFQFNKTFGFQIMFLYVYIGIVALEVIGSAIHKEENNWSQLYFFDAVNMIMGIILAVTCQMSIKESEQTVTVCYNLLLNIPAESNNKTDRMIRSELVLLAQEATDQGPQFSAAGFFPIDYTMIFGLIGTVTSYVVVLIQVM